MKNQIILWSASALLAFLLGYIKAVTNINYPVTGTFGIEGKKVSYKLDKISFDKTSYRNIIIGDVSGLGGKIVMLNQDNQTEINMIGIDKGLAGEIPALKPGKKLFYKIKLSYDKNTYDIPEKGFVSLTFWGKIPSAVKGIYLLLLYGGLLLSIRSGMELFNKNKFLKKITFITCSFFILNTILVNPLYNSYKLGAINNFVPAFNDLFEPALIFITLVWIIGTIILFFKKYILITTISAGIITVILFFLLPSV